MKKILKLGLPVNSLVIDGQSILKVPVLPESVKDLLICLYLLQDNLIEACVLIDDMIET